MTSRRLVQVRETARVSAAWRNADGSAAIYITSDPAVNAVTLTLANALGTALTIPAGTPAAYGALPEGQGAVYVFFNGLLGLAEVRRIGTSTAGWAVAAFEVDGAGYLCLAPSAGVVVADGDSLTLSFTDVTASGSPVSGYTDVALAGTSPSEDPIPAFVAVHYPPEPGNKVLHLVAGFVRDVVLTGTGESNELTLFLTNPGSEPLVPSGTWGPSPPTFRLSFACGTSAGALTTTALAANIDVSTGTLNGNVWKPPAKHTLGDVPYWVLQPDPNGGQTVLGTGQDATVEFTVSNVVTQLPQGSTPAYLSWTGVPGFDDGVVGFELVKVDPVRVTSFTATPASFEDLVAPAVASLSFTVENASHVAILGTPYAARVVSEPWTGTQDVTVATTTTYTLLATSAETGQQVVRSLEVRVTPDLFHLVPKGTILMWSGSFADVPPGWHLCDGTQGTPNLVDRFVLGAGPSARAPGATGGSPGHDHTASMSANTTSSGNHQHLPDPDWYGNGVSGPGSYTIVDRRGKAVNQSWTTVNGQHFHVVAAAVGVASRDTLPPWYALCLIMKVT